MSVQANKFTLKGGPPNLQTTFTYVDGLFGPVVTFAGEAMPPRTFFGSAVRVLSVGIGTLVTVNIRMTIDTGGTDFSVLLPFVVLANPTSTQAISTDGIFTQYKGPDSPPVGVRDTYEFLPMTGTASHI